MHSTSNKFQTLRLRPHQIAKACSLLRLTEAVSCWGSVRSCCSSSVPCLVERRWYPPSFATSRLYSDNLGWISCWPSLAVLLSSVSSERRRGPLAPCYRDNSHTTMSLQEPLAAAVWGSQCGSPCHTYHRTSACYRPQAGRTTCTSYTQCTARNVERI